MGLFFKGCRLWQDTIAIRNIFLSIVYLGLHFCLMKSYQRAAMRSDRLGIFRLLSFTDGSSTYQKMCCISECEYGYTDHHTIRNPFVDLMSFFEVAKIS